MIRSLITYFVHCTMHIIKSLQHHNIFYINIFYIIRDFITWRLIFIKMTCLEFNFMFKLTRFQSQFNLGGVGLIVKYIYIDYIDTIIVYLQIFRIYFCLWFLRPIYDNWWIYSSENQTDGKNIMRRNYPKKSITRKRKLLGSDVLS